MNLDYTDEKLASLESEVGGLFAQISGFSPATADESQERIERILRRVRLENRIQEESENSGE